MNGFRPRPGQRRVLAYREGKMGISAVPGSGKTRTLAELAARLVAERIGEGEEVLVVTLVNSAVDSLKARINVSVAERGLLPGLGYRVRTLHGLAHDLVRERPGLVGLSEDFAILDERESDLVRDDAVESWLRTHPEAVDAFLGPAWEGDRAAWIKQERWPALAKEIAGAFIQRAKDLEMAAEPVLERLAGMGREERLSLLRLGAETYSAYQRSLAYRGAVDFHDLIRLALEALRSDAGYLARLQARYTYILEDEAQDSSLLQEKILRLMAGDRGNWVRVGDPNQAIYETFTNANPLYLRRFLEEEGVTRVALDESGRSQPCVIELANHLVKWAIEEHPEAEVRRAFLLQHIEPTGPGDPQPNPPADPQAIRLVRRQLTPEEELLLVADSLERWLPHHPSSSVAVLVPRNARGFDFIELLKRRNLPYVELLRSTSVTRHTAGALGNLLRCLAEPTSSRRLADAFRVWRRGDREDGREQRLTGSVAEVIRQVGQVEAYLWPRADRDWLLAQSEDLPPEELALLAEFCEVARRWHRAAALPIDQLVLTLANELFREPAELALAYKLAVLLDEVARSHPAYRLVELVEELAIIARNERRFLGLSGEDSGFDPPLGKVTVATIHKAKGLEWDRVYLLSVNNYDFPSGLSSDTYISERWFVRDGLNLEAEALAQLEWLRETARDPAGRAEESPAQEAGWIEGPATHQARLAYVAERLRLLYVGITRAKRDLIVTWNTGRKQEKLQPAVALEALLTYWQNRSTVDGGSGSDSRTCSREA